MDLIEYRYRKHHGLPLSVPEPELNRPSPERQRGFVTVTEAKTILTAPASSTAAGFDAPLGHSNPHFLWVGGRYVGAEVANRNNAFWATADLEMGQPTVKNGPLNWLHEARHVIGSLTDTRLVRPEAETASTSQPHLAVQAGIWKWLYPDEANVVEMASEAGALWFSMECVSREVSCMAEGCGKSYPYQQTVQEKASLCDHMQTRGAPRRFVDPTFLGSAVIVPPARPGWAEADARVLREAARMTEQTYNYAHPTVDAAEWEQMMAQVVRFADV